MTTRKFAILRPPYTPTKLTLSYDTPLPRANDEVVQALKKCYEKHHNVYMHHIAALTARAPVRHSADDPVR